MKGFYNCTCFGWLAFIKSSWSMNIGHYHSTMVDCFYFNIFLFMDMLDIDSLVDSLIHRLSSHIFRTIWCNTDMFYLKLLIRFSLLINCKSNWLARHWVFRIGWFYVEVQQISGLVLLRSSGLLCVYHIAIFLCQHTFWHAYWDHNRLIRTQRYGFRALKSA